MAQLVGCLNPYVYPWCERREPQLMNWPCYLAGHHWIHSGKPQYLSPYGIPAAEPIAMISGWSQCALCACLHSLTCKWAGTISWFCCSGICKQLLCFDCYVCGISCLCNSKKLPVWCLACPWWYTCHCQWNRYQCSDLWEIRFPRASFNVNCTAYDLEHRARMSVLYSHSLWDMRILYMIFSLSCTLIMWRLALKILFLIVIQQLVWQHVQHTMREIRFLLRVYPRPGDHVVTRFKEFEWYIMWLLWK